MTPDWEEEGKKKRFQGQDFKYVMPWITCLRLVLKRDWKIVFSIIEYLLFVLFFPRVSVFCGGFFLTADVLLQSNLANYFG